MAPRRTVLVVVIGAAILLGAVVGFERFVQSSPQPVNQLARFDGQGWSLDYPAAWRLFPSQIFEHYPGEDAFLTTEPVDESRVCKLDAQGNSCDLRSIDVAPGNVIFGLGWGAWMTTGPEDWVHPSEGQPIKVGGTPATEIQAVEADQMTLTCGSCASRTSATGSRSRRGSASRSAPIGLPRFAP